MINYPVTFEASAVASAGMDSAWKVSAASYESTCSVPTAFEGPGGTFSPEDYFLLSLQNCFVASFKVFAQYSRLNFTTLKVDAQLSVNKDQDGKPWMESVQLKIHLSGADNEKKAQLLIAKTLENGFILRSVKTTIIPEIILD